MKHDRDLVWRAAAERDELILREIDKGWEPPCSGKDLRQAARDALKAIARDIPDPAEYAAQMPLAWAEALFTCIRTRTNEWRVVHAEMVPPMRAAGLISVGKEPTLSGFGADVRKALLKEERD